MDTRPIAENAKISVTVSGGGHRATVWAFGALAALVHHDLHRQVNCVASVSGGSIANGVLATNDTSLAAYGSIEEFAEATRKTLLLAADQGVFPVGVPTRRFVRQLLVLAVLTALALLGTLSALAALGRSGALLSWAIAGAVLGVLAAIGARNVRSLQAPKDKKPVAEGGTKARRILIGPLLVGVPVAVWAGAGTVSSADRLRDGVVVVVVWFIATVVLGAWALSSLGRRGEWVRDAYGAELFLADAKKPITLAQTTKDVHHVICATDLQSGDHFYFSREFLYGYQEGIDTTAPSTVTLAEAVQASAALPGAFPPVVVRTGAFMRSTPHEREPHPSPDLSEVVLSDGGVYDNMGDQWERGFAQRAAAYPAIASSQEPAARLLVVANASAAWDWKPLSGKRRGLKFELAGLIRDQGVQYDVSTAHRRRAAVAGFRQTESAIEAASQAGDDIDAVPGLIGTLAMIDRSPYTVINGFLPADDKDSDERQSRALEAKRHLDALDRNWDTIARDNAAIATTLDAIGRAETLQLLEHAYTLVNVGLYVIHGIGTLSEFPATAFSFLDEPNE